LEKTSNKNESQIFSIPLFDDNRGSVSDVSYIFKSLNLINIEKIANIICVRSKRDVLRGLHFQKREPQRKIIHLIKGKILDVTVNINPSASDFLKPNYFNMDAKKNNCLFVPENFLHGYRVLSKEAIIQYYMDQPYIKENQISVKLDDELLAINWGTQGDLIVSEKDKKGLDLKTFLKLLHDKNI
jgi:dTDP-4-dehydrorhamnose 3,5-epimerase